jgi:hypothetical protein
MRRRSTSEKGKKKKKDKVSWFRPGTPMFLGIMGLTHLRDGRLRSFMDEASSDLTKASPATTTTNLMVPICIYSTDVTHGLPFREEGKTKRGFRYDGHLHDFPISISWQ